MQEALGISDKMIMGRIPKLAVAALFLLAGHVLAIAIMKPGRMASMFSDFIQLLVALLAAFTCYAASRRSHHFANLFWFSSASAFALWSLGQAVDIHFLYYTVPPDLANFYSVLIFFLSAAPLFLVIFLPSRVEESGVHWEWVLDAIQIAVLILALYIYLIHIPTVIRGENRMAPLRLEVLHLRNILLAAGLIGRAIVDRSPSVRKLLVPAAVIVGFYTVGSWFGNHAPAVAGAESASWYDLIWTVPFCLATVGAAVWTDLAESPPAVGKPARISVVLFVYLASLIMPVLLLLMYEEVVREQIIVGLSALMISIVCYTLRLAVVQNQRRRTMEALWESESHYRLLFERNRAGMFRSTFDGRILDCNQAIVEMFGYTREELAGQPSHVLFPGGKEERDARVALLRQEGQVANYEKCYRHKDGHQVWVIQNLAIIQDTQGAPVIEGTMVDITERKLADKEIAEWKRRYDAAVSASGQIIYDSDPATRRIVFGGALREVLGCDPGNFATQTEAWRGLIHPEDLPAYLDAMQRALENGQQFEIEYRVRRVDGSYRTLREKGRVELDAGSRAPRVVGFLTDVTAQRQLEQQLRQSQKMEAVGRLSGGVAHDFNNLLTVIMGYSAIQLESLAASHPLRQSAEEIKAAADRAASLTQQLLAFSRQQVLQPRTLNLNRVVSDLGNILHRLIGEDIEMLTLLDPELRSVTADPGQMEQILLNLIVNARDAMPNGGKLTIETANVQLREGYAATHSYVKPGEYVRLAVSDTGIGMDAGTKGRVFEPFFTTKAVGKGTGLGLSTVYGIVKQSGGHIEVYSELGRGTTFKVYLPQVGAAPLAAEAEVRRTPHPRGSETILLVEDEPQLRDLAKTALVLNGYKVLLAVNADDIEFYCGSQTPAIDLLLTDVVMPKFSGKEVSDRITRRFPAAKTLYMSGYTANAIVHHGVLDEGIFFLQKPFTPTELAAKVREVLDHPAAE